VQIANHSTPLDWKPSLKPNNEGSVVTGTEGRRRGAWIQLACRRF